MSISLETIDYQIKDYFPDHLNSLVEEIYNDMDKPAYRNEAAVDSHPNLIKIEKAIFERFGLLVVFRQELKMFSSAAIVPFFKDYERTNSYVQQLIDSTNANSSVKAVQAIRSIIKQRKETQKKIHNKTGYINTKLAKVGGYMSEVGHYLIIDFIKLSKTYGVSVQEMVAIILHEIGHAFDGLEEHFRLQSTNRAILDVLTDLSDNKPDKALYKYKHTFSEQEYKNSSLSTSSERIDFCSDLAKRYVGEVGSQLQSSKYDETNFENMADSFATRFGMGKHLVSGLRKLYANNPKFMDNNKSMRVLATSLDALSLACVFLILPIYGFIVYTVVMSYLLRVSSGTMTYDTPVDRITRIRNTIVHSLLKNKQLPRDVVVDALDQVDFIEKIAKESMVYKDMLSSLGDVLYSDARQDKYYIDLQQTIESQLNNRLFVQSAQLRVSN